MVLYFRKVIYRHNFGEYGTRRHLRHEAAVGSSQSGCEQQRAVRELLHSAD